jgi:hypothetical protein
LEHSREIKKSTFNEYLSTVTGFYKYAQSRQELDSQICTGR